MNARSRGPATLLVTMMVGVFAALRISLAISPNSDLDVFGYNIHHLFTGILIVTACAIPLSLGVRPGRTRNGLVAGLGVGLGLVLDEWVYLIATDGTNKSYLLPVSLWGGVVMIGLAALYAVACHLLSKHHDV